MMRLHLQDINFLLANTSAKSVIDKLIKARDELMSTNEYSLRRALIIFSNDELTEIQDILGDLLASDGVTDGEINAFGGKIETLIDLISDDLSNDI